MNSHKVGWKIFNPCGFSSCINGRHDIYSKIHSTFYFTTHLIQTDPKRKQTLILSTITYLRDRLYLVAGTKMLVLSFKLDTNNSYWCNYAIMDIQWSWQKQGIFWLFVHHIFNGNQYLISWGKHSFSSRQTSCNVTSRGPRDQLLLS